MPQYCLFFFLVCSMESRHNTTAIPNSPGRFNILHGKQAATSKIMNLESLFSRWWAAIQELKTLGWFMWVSHCSAMPVKISQFHQISWRPLLIEDFQPLMHEACDGVRELMYALQRLSGHKQINHLIQCDKIPSVPQQLPDVGSSLFRRWKG